MLKQSFLLLASTTLSLIAISNPAIAGSFKFDYKLTSPDSTGLDLFGHSIALDGDLALIGASNNLPTGSAYLFDVTSGELLQKFTAPDNTKRDIFGSTVALAENLALIGGYPLEDGNSSAYLFDINNGNLLHTFTNPNEFKTQGSLFGYSLALTKDVALINAPGDNSTHLFDTQSGNFLSTLSSTVDYGTNKVTADGGLALIANRGGTSL
ncbi:MAG: hypothetical protein F6J87_08090 [Spirulina sp. SIO3F2]|nr:hypothetical protein [Spirulina sp. SIO3F2]